MRGFAVLLDLDRYLFAQRQKHGFCECLFTRLFKPDFLVARDFMRRFSHAGEELGVKCPQLKRLTKSGN